MRPSPTAALAALALAAGGARAEITPIPVAVQATAVPLNREQLQQTRVGPLAWAGGVSLKAPRTPQFGGVSGLDVAADGRFVAITDAGDMIRGQLRLDANGRLRGVEAVTLQRMTDEHGRPFESKDDGDAEDVTLLPRDRVAVSFEQEHRILVYGPGSEPPRRLPVPPVRMPDNAGIEALAYWVDPKSGEERLMVGIERGDAFSCDLDGRDCRQVLVARRDDPKGFRLTGLDALPDGRLVAVYRAASLFGGLRAVVAEVRPGDPRPVRPLAQLAGALTVDNMEAIAAVPSPDGGVRLYVASDDNFKFFQRTLLLAFDWRPGRGQTPLGPATAGVP